LDHQLKHQESQHKTLFRKYKYFNIIITTNTQLILLYRVIFCEAIAIYGVIVAILLTNKPTEWKWNDQASLAPELRQ